MTLIRQKEPGDAWETISVGAPQALPFYADEAAVSAALGNAEWIVAELGSGGVAIYGKSAAGALYGLHFGS